MPKDTSATPPRLPRAGKPAEAKASKGAPKSARSRLSRAEIITLFDRLRAKTPEPKGELDYVNPFTLLVAVVLSAQTTDAGVNRATKPLFAEADTAQKMLAFGEARLAEAIHSLGFFNTKSRNVMALSRALVEEHGGEVP